jgi:uncharacterized membrane protein HdeD (DUF308 family)
LNATHSAGSKLLADMNSNAAWLLGIGALSILLGVAGLYFKLTISETSVRYIGGVLIVASVIQAIDVYRMRQWLRRFWYALGVVVYVSGGLMMLVFPDQSANLVIMLLGMALVGVGIFRIVIALQLRAGLKLWAVVAAIGAVSIALGAMLMARWPWPPLNVLGTFITVELLLGGLSFVYLGIAAKSHSSDASLPAPG